MMNRSARPIQSVVINIPKFTFYTFSPTWATKVKNIVDSMNSGRPNLLAAYADGLRALADSLLAEPLSEPSPEYVPIPYLHFRPIPPATVTPFRELESHPVHGKPEKVSRPTPIEDPNVVRDQGFLIFGTWSIGN